MLASLVLAAGVSFAVSVDGGTIDVRADGVPAVGEAALRGWVESAARAVAGYCGRFPVARATLTVLTGGRGRVGYGTTWCRGGPLIRMAVGSSATQADLDDDWVLTHEMLHTAMPSLEDGSSWAEEGFATYVEPVARARRGGLSAERVWRDLVIGLPKGLPGPRDGGLDGTESWGRTYWGGALFWLLADIGIREKTSNARGLEDALRAILEQHGGVCSSLRLRAMLATGDRVAGVRVLEDLHARLGPRAEAVDLDALWRRLGVRLSEGKVTFDDRAPLAAIRRAITAERKGSDRR